VRTVHAEANAIAQAARQGVRIDASTIYVTASPCWGCFRLIANAGIVRVCFGEFYRDLVFLMLRPISKSNSSICRALSPRAAAV